MARTVYTPHNEATERAALRRRVKQLYEWFNRDLSEKCFSLIDPTLREQAKVELSSYTAGLRAFKKV